MYPIALQRVNLGRVPAPGWAKHLPYSHTEEVLSVIGRQRGSVRNRTAAQSRFVRVSCVADPDPKLEHLLKAERLAFARYDRLRGYPGDVQEVALALWTEATEAVRKYRSKHP